MNTTPTLGPIYDAMCIGLSKISTDLKAIGDTIDKMGEKLDTIGDKMDTIGSNIETTGDAQKELFTEEDVRKVCRFGNTSPYLARHYLTKYNGDVTHTVMVLCPSYLRTGLPTSWYDD